MLHDPPARHRCRLRESSMWRFLRSLGAGRFDAQHPRSDLFPTRRRTSRRSLDRRGRDQEQRLQMAWTQLSSWLFWIRFYRRIAPPDGVAATQRMRPSTTTQIGPTHFETLFSSVTCERRFLLFIFLFVNQGPQFRIR